MKLEEYIHKNHGFIGKKIMAAFFMCVFLLSRPTATEATTIPNDPSFSFLMSIFSQIGVLRAWDRIIGSSSIIVAVIDSGVDVNHPDLKENIWVNSVERFNGLDDDQNGYIDDINGWDFVGKDSGVVPDVGLDAVTGKAFDDIGINHGTIVAGLIGAVGNNGLDGAGVAMKVKIMALKAIDNHGEGDERNVIKAIDYAVANHASIINLSFSGPEASAEFKSAIKRANSAGVLVVVAAGNDRESGNGDLDFSPKFPVCIDKGGNEDLVVGVGAVDENDTITAFTNFGSCIDIVAPGTHIASTVFYDSTREKFKKSFDGYYSGTSLAAPLVSGTAVLIRALNPSWTVDDVKAALYASADDVDFKNPSFRGKLGHGRLNADRATRLKIESVQIITQSNAPVTELQEIQQTGTIIVSPTTGGKGEVRSFDFSNGFQNSIQPLGEIKTGVQFTTSDVDNDGAEEFIFTWGGNVIITEQSGSVHTKFKTGFNKKDILSVAVGDINNDHNDEIVVASESSKLIRIFRMDGKKISEFIGTPEKKIKGLRVAVAAVATDHIPKIITTHTGGQFSTDVWVYANTGKLFSSFLAFEGKEPFGLRIAAGDIDLDGTAEIVTSRDGIAPPLVRVYNFIGVPITSFMPFPLTFNGGVSIAVGSLNDQQGVIVLGALKGGGPHVKIVDIGGNMINDFFAFDKSFRGGVNVGFYRDNKN